MTVELLWLVATLALQTAAIALVPWPWSLVTAGGALGAARVAGASPRRLARVVRVVAILTGPVLVVRLATDFSGTTVAQWGDYTSRLITAAAVATALLAARGTTGVARGLSLATRIVPTRRPVLADIVVSALYVLPVVTRRLRDAWDAGRIRIPASGPTRGVHRGSAARRRLTAAPRAAFLSVATVPRRRAEAMVVRGVVKGAPR